MKKGFLILGTILLFGFTPSERLEENTDAQPIANNEAIVKEIIELNQIIEGKIEKAEMLEVQAAMILVKDNNSEKGLNLLQEAKLQHMMILKYKAAISCRTQILTNN